MRLSSLLYLAGAALASAASWSFEDASISVQEVRGSELSPKKSYASHFSPHQSDINLYSFTPGKPIKDMVTLSSTGSVRLALTITNGGKPRRPHQGFLTITNPESGLEEAFPLTINDNGNSRFDLVGGGRWTEL